MSDYQERVLTEQKELSVKINSLTNFLTNINKIKDLSDINLNLLQKQLELMLSYNRILQMRIALF